jgi:succinoglycan biosynthesis protein ExoW
MMHDGFDSSPAGQPSSPNETRQAAGGRVAVVIPFFQRKPGILRRALNSVAAQRLPAGWSVEVIVVDDGSPCPAEDEVLGLDFGDTFRLKLVRQANGGVSAARNRGLDEAGAGATLIAFLDSDDIWPPDHLARAILAWEQGFDFYFADHFREGHYASYYHAHAPRIVAILSSSSEQLVEIAEDKLTALILAEFPCHASTVVYCNAINPQLRFKAYLRSAEDILFLTHLASSASRVCADKLSKIECGEGVNIWHSSWTAIGKNDCLKVLTIKVDALVGQRLISREVNLTGQGARENRELISECRRELAYHVVRNFTKSPKHVVQAIGRLAVISPSTALTLPGEVMRGALKRASRLAHGGASVR